MGTARAGNVRLGPGGDDRDDQPRAAAQQIEGGRADAASGAVHEHGLAVPEPGPVQREPGRDVIEVEGSSLCPAHRVGDADRVPRDAKDPFGE